MDWIKRYILFHKKRHPAEMGAVEIEAFLTHLAVNEKVSASGQNQAYSALLFLYREVLHQDISIPLQALRAKNPKRLPTVLTKWEVQQVFAHLSGIYRLKAHLALWFRSALDGRPAPAGRAFQKFNVRLFSEQQAPLSSEASNVSLQACALKSCWQHCFVGQLSELSYNFYGDTSINGVCKTVQR